jgi:hypothetical protein
MYCYYYYMCLANYGASKAVNLCSRYVEKSTKYVEQKCASYFRELNQLYCSLTVASASSFRPLQVFVMSSIAICFWFFKWSLEYSVCVQSPTPLNTKIYLISYSPLKKFLGGRLVSAQAAPFPVKPVSKNAWTLNFIFGDQVRILSFFYLAKIIKKTSFLLFCDFFMTLI